MSIFLDRWVPFINTFSLSTCLMRNTAAASQELSSPGGVIRISNPSSGFLCFFSFSNKDIMDMTNTLASLLCLVWGSLGSVYWPILSSSSFAPLGPRLPFGKPAGAERQRSSVLSEASLNMWSQSPLVVFIVSLASDPSCHFWTVEHILSWVRFTL